MIGLTPKADRPVAGSFVNDAFAIGHRLRDGAKFTAATQIVKVPLVIVGGGMAGLAAAWRLDKRGFRDFVLLEMEKQAGGNSRWGENEISAYPWAAHYVPLPNKESTLVRELFADLGCFRGGEWEERYLCFSPQERLFLHGRWQEGIEPNTALTAADRSQFKRFAEQMEQFRATGQFTIPMELGSKPAALDRVSMAHWLREQGFDSPYLNWYIDYACRDDYGALAADTSAWAGVHYFASRQRSEKGPLTWPEGNGWIAKKLIAKLQTYIRTGSPAHRITRQNRKWRVAAGDVEYLAGAVIFAAPTFLVPYILEHAPAVRNFEYSPWLTANLTLDRLPRQHGAEMAWDNVVYNSPSLGYVVATHQSLRTRTERTVWTWYYSLARGAPSANRRLLLEKDCGYWKQFILDDLSRAHPDIRACVSRIDVMRMGHAMARPQPGFLTSPERLRFAGASGSLLFANSDLSGFSIFEEAQYRGVQAADRTLYLLSGSR